MSWRGGSPILGLQCSAGNCRAPAVGVRWLSVGRSAANVCHIIVCSLTPPTKKPGGTHLKPDKSTVSALLARWLSGCMLRGSLFAMRSRFIVTHGSPCRRESHDDPMQSLLDSSRSGILAVGSTSRFARTAWCALPVICVGCRRWSRLPWSLVRNVVAIPFGVPFGCLGLRRPQCSRDHRGPLFHVGDGPDSVAGGAAVSRWHSVSLVGLFLGVCLYLQ
jgi:hypothetical protein